MSSASANRTALPPHVARWRAGEVSDQRHLAAPLRGIQYLEMLALLHSQLNTATYLEIGTFTGRSLAFVSCPAISIDPVCRLAADFIQSRPHLHVFTETSDSFFEKRDPREILGKEIDLAFLDGMHLFEFLLRNFMNAEKYCSDLSVIAMHDCVPFSSAIVARKQHAPKNPDLEQYDVAPGAWAGDVWKMLPILKKYRPDLCITVFDCPGTGLVTVSNLDPRSHVLQENYRDIVAEYMNSSILDYGVTEFQKTIGMKESRKLKEDGQIIEVIFGRDKNIRSNIS